MKRKYTAYTEAVYIEQEDGSYRWLGRVYKYKNGDGPIDIQDGIAKDRTTAIIDVKTWSDRILNDNYAIPELSVV